ncbi:MAG TPA: peptide ABC transporter substrate-binding protein [Verrucomicrobiae bacterium]|jgi:oligopeptide transport system substrate-binding protein|nr:peptide ABC transporter substrate-binding protein [Verrucomicrobiae bacterium]
MSLASRSREQSPGGGRRLLTLWLGLLLLAGCNVKEPKADLVIINGPDPETLDPALGTGIEDLRIIAALFEGLARNDPVTARPIPGLAESWEMSPDGCVYTFHLRDNLWWSPGQPITAVDVIYSWLRVLDPRTASEYAGQLFYIKNAEAYNSGKIQDPALVGAHALDARTVRVELNHPTAFFLDLCAFQTLAVVPRQIIEKDGDDWMQARPLPTSGPYLLQQWRLNDKIRLVKNPYYWDATNTRCAVVDCLPISAPDTALNLYQTGGADIIWDRDNIPSELLDELAPRPDYHTFPYQGTYFLRCNTTRTPFNDPRVRKALALTIDKRRLVEKILRGGEPVADHLVPDGTANYQQATGLGYDPDLARRLLAEAGFPGGTNFPHFSFLFDSASGGEKIHEKVAVELKEMWEKQLGIQVELRQMEKRVYQTAQKTRDYDVSRSTWIGDYNDPNTFLDLFRSDNGNNRTGWANARYDALMDEANRQVDLTRRAALLREVEMILVHDEVPIIPIYFYVGFNYYNPERIKGIYPNILDDHPLNAIWKTGVAKWEPFSGRATFSLPVNPNREWSLLSPALSSTSVWRRGRSSPGVRPGQLLSDFSKRSAAPFPLLGERVRVRAGLPDNCILPEKE